MLNSFSSYILTFGLVLCAFVATSQRAMLLDFDYTKADSHAINYPDLRYDDAALLAKNLCEGYDTEHEKFRIIFRWITQNVEYKYGRQGTDPNEILRKGKAVCEGYTSLLEAMCRAVGLKCETILGYSKSYVDFDIPLQMKEPTHSWNAIYLLGEWHLVDVTWSAGNFDPKRRKFKRSFDETWFLTDPEFFIYSHYPVNLRWLLNNEPMKKRDFKRMPILAKYGYETGIRPKGTRGYIKGNFRYKFETASKFEWIGMRMADEDGMIGLFPETRGCFIKVQNTFEKRRNGGFYLYMDGEPILVFYKKK
jgi:transglutaminase/protease-like cytokinesis protein 3